jgi:hypothetical protein
MSALGRRARMGLAAWRERNSKATGQAVADWQAVIDAVQGLGVVPDVPNPAHRGQPGGPVPAPAPRDSPA